MFARIVVAWLSFAASISLRAHAAQMAVIEDEQAITIDTPQLQAVIRKQGYVSGVAGGSLLDKQTGFRDLGHGLDIADFILEPGSDEAYREQLDPRMRYEFGTLFHGEIAKRKIEGPQICTQAKKLDWKVIRGDGFVALKAQHVYTKAAPGKRTGSTWTQTLVFPAGKRYFVSSQRIDAVNASEAMIFRIDMPGHIKHNNGDRLAAVYLSYHGRIDPSAFTENFPPDGRFIYQRGITPMPQRFIRAYQPRDPESGKPGPWLAGMTLDPDDVHEAWCHQRGYVCMIEEFGGKPIKAGEHFSAAFIVGWFDSIDQMNRVYDEHRGHSGLSVDRTGWRLTP